ncbi:hypothetical protein EVAR_29661_1 [Eumeta japonica]|uniref:Uncharacterized protein n=1 Tax=Eumeta variegata TaxID=151549 RepID=A0A4C1W6S4_EUMVA|nr:hypothetical protein EVAR_29661_1 [Eumeta japonica]
MGGDERGDIPAVGRSCVSLCRHTTSTTALWNEFCTEGYRHVSAMIKPRSTPVLAQLSAPAVVATSATSSVSVGCLRSNPSILKYRHSNLIQRRCLVIYDRSLGDTNYSRYSIQNHMCNKRDSLKRTCFRLSRLFVYRGVAGSHLPPPAAWSRPWHIARGPSMP